MAGTTKRLEGKVALITGAASGVGECTAKLFAEHGAKIVIADIQDQLGQGVCEIIGSSNSIYVHCDVTKEEDVKNVVDIAYATYGKLDIMFNNAGIMDPYQARVIDNEKTDFERVLSVNVTGVFLGMKHAARVMVPARSGSIISMASTASNIGGVTTHAYTCAKHAVVGLTKNMAVELGQFGIRVNCLSPSVMATPMATNFLGLYGEDFENKVNLTTNLKGVTLTVDDVAKTALFLVSDEAKYISGQNLFIDGGFDNMDPTRRLEGKVALITGAASGIGECTAKLFAKHGAKVVIADVQDDLGQLVCEAIGSTNSVYVHCDVTNEEDVKDAAQQNLLAQYGLSISQGQQPVQHNNTMGLRPNAPPGFQQTQPHQPTFGFNGHQQALYSAAIKTNSSSTSGNNLSTIFNSRIYPSVLVGDGKSIPGAIARYQLPTISGLVKFSSDVTARVTFIQSRLRRTLKLFGGRKRGTNTWSTGK
ncbi:secoisolariciresinol dehydrogenase-like protein [Tanacetum coccineum]